MNKSNKTKLENKFNIFNIHDERKLSGTYKLQFKYMYYDDTCECTFTNTCIVKSNETINDALERWLNN